MCNYSSLSFLLDKMFDVVIKGGEEWSMQEEVFGEKFWGVRSLVHEKEIHILPREKEKKRKKSGCKIFGEFPRVLAWGSESEKVSYEYREPTKS